jgi:Mg2+ and Co2+ transporter CorA
LLFEQIKGALEKKPRTYRQIARKDYLEVAKKRRVSQKDRRKAIKKQLQYMKRNLSHIDQLISSGASLENLTNRQYKMLLVVAEIYRQQLWLDENKKLNRVMAKLSHTSQTAIAITFLVMNLSTHLSRVFYAFLCLFLKNRLFSKFNISENYNSASY